MKKRKNDLPQGWTQAKVRRVLTHYERQTPEAAVAEDEAMYKNRKHSLIAVPVRLVPAVRKLLGERTR